MDNTLKQIEDFIQSGLAERFFKVFGIPLLFYNGPDVKTVATKMLKDRGMPAYPYAVAKVSSWSISEGTYKPNTMLRRGLMGSSSHDHVLCYELNMLPVTTSYEISVYIQDFPGLRKFGKEWLMAATRNNLKFTVAYAVRDIDINLQMDKNLNVPSREGGVSEVKEYVMSTNLTLFGYMSDQLKTRQAVTDLEMQLQLLESLGTKGQIITIFSAGWPAAECKSCTDVPDGGGGTGDDANFVYTRNDPSTMWTITHNLNKFPSVMIVDAFGNVVEATVNYPSLNVVVVTFGALFTGKAFLN